MTKLKRLLSYSGIFLLTMCLAAGFVILQFLFSNKNSVPELVVSAEDTTFSQVLNKVMNSDNISADFDVTVSFGGENLELAGVLELDLAKILNAGDDIIGALEVSVDCNVLSNGEILPLTIKVKEGMCYTTVANNQLKFKLTDTMQNVGTILTLIGVEIPTGDIMADFDMSSLMGLMENVTTETTENGYKVLIPLFDYGTAEIIADKEYNITEINLNELSIEGVVATVQLEVKTDKENFEIPVLDEEANGLDVSNLMKFVTAVSNIVSDKQVAGNLTLKTKHFENSFDFGADFNNRNYAYLTSNILGKELQVLANDDNVYLAFNDFKFKASYGEIMSVVNFVKDYIETLTNVSIEEEVQNQLDNLNQENLTISDIFEKLNIVSVDIKGILSALTFENDGNTLVFDYKGVKLVVALNENQLSTIDFSYGDYAISIDLNGTLQEIEVVDSEYVNYTFYQEIYNRIKTFVSSKKVALKTAVGLGENEYVVDIKADLNKGFDIELKTEILDYNIKVNVLDNILYLQLNEQKVSYALKNGENLANILGGVLKTLDIENLEESAKGEVEKLTQELGEMLNQLLNITEEQVFEILSYFALNYINNNQVDINIDNYKVSFAVANDNLLDVLVEYKDVKVLVNVSDKDWNFELNKEEYVAVDNINAVVNTVVEIVNNKQATLTGNVTYKTYTLPVTIRFDLSENYVEFNTTVLDQDILVVVENQDIFVKVGNIKVKTDISELNDLYNLILDLLEESSVIEKEVVSNTTNDILNSAKVITLVDILKTIKLSSNSESITVEYEDFIAKLFVDEDKLSEVEVEYGQISANFEIATDIAKTYIDKENFVPYTHFTEIYERFYNLTQNKKFEVVVFIELDKTYKVNAKVDLNRESVELKTTISDYDVNVTLLNNTIYLKVNNQQVSYKLDSIKDLVEIVAVLVGEENINKVETKLTEKIDTLKNMLAEFKNELNSVSEESIVEILNSFDINNLYNNGVGVAFGDVKLAVSVCEENLLVANVNYQNNAFEIILSDNDFDIVVNEAEYVAIDNINAVINTIIDILNNKQVTLSGNLSYKEISLPVTIKIDFKDEIYVELKTTISNKDVMVVYTGKEVFVKFDELRFMAENEDVKNLIGFVVNVLSENGVEVDTQNLTNLVCDIENDLKTLTLLDVLNGFALESSENTLSVKLDNAELKMEVCDNALSFVEVKTKDIGLNMQVKATAEFENIVKADYVNYEFYEAIYNRVEDVIKNKKATAILTLDIDGEVYEVVAKVDLSNGTKIQLSTNIDKFDIQLNLIDNVLFVKVNEQKLSYTMPSLDDFKTALAFVLDNLGVKQEDITSIANEMAEKLNNVASEFANITEQQIFDILNTIAINSLTNNKVDVTYDNIRVCLTVCQNEVLDLVIKTGDIEVSFVADDKEFSFDIVESEYTNLDNINAVVGTVVEIVNNKQVTLTGNVTYKTLTLPVTIKADFNANYVEFNTTVLEKDICLVYTNDKVYLTVDDLKVMATTSEISSLVNMLIEVLNSNGANINVEEITTKANEATEKISDTTLTNISILDILKTLKLTNQNKDNLTVSYNDITVSLNQTDGKLDNINFTMPSIAANFDISTTATKKTFVDNDYVKVAEIENIYNKVKAIVDARAMNIVADVKYGDYEFNGNISLDLSDLNDPKLRIYNAYFNEYKIDITYIGNTLYAKINELKVYLAVDLDNIQDVLDKVGYAYNNFTNSNLDIPNIKAMIDDYKQMFEDMLNSTEDFDFEDFMDIYNKITLNSISKFKVDGVYDNIKLIAEINGANLVDVNVEFDDVKANVSIDKKQTAIYVPDLTDYSNLNPVVDILGKVTDTFSTKKFGLSTTIEVMGEKISITGYADLSDFENGPKVFATATIANTPVYITYFEEVFYFEAKGLKMSATLSELQQLFEVDIKKFIETTLDETLKGIENDLNAMLESLDILDSVVKEENGLTLCTSMGLDLTFVESASKIETIVVDYDDIGLNATLNVLGYTGTISKPSGEFTVYKNGIKLMNTFIDFVTNETFNVAISGTAASEALDFVFDIKQKDAYITSINAKGSIGTGTNLQIGYLGEEKYILVNGNKVYDYTEEQAQTNTVYTNPSFVFVDYNGLKIKLDTLLIDKIIGFVTGLFNIDLSVVYDLLNVNIPSYDMEVMQGLVTGYDTEVKLPVDENSGLEETLNLLESINLSMDGTILTVSLTDGGKAIVKTEVVDGVTRIATLELVDVAMGEDKINLLIDFYCELPSDMSSIPSRDDAAYMDLSTIGNFMEVVVNTANLKRFKLQGEALINLGSYKFESIDVFADIDLVKTVRSDGSYVWKPYIVVWLKGLPDSTTTLSGILLEDAVTSNNGKNHQAVLYIVDNDIYIYRRIDKSKSVMTGFLKWETQYFSEVLEQKKMSFDDLSTTAGVVELLDSIVGLSSMLDGIVKSAFENVSAPSDYSPEKIFYNTYDSSSNTYTRSYTYDGKYHILLNGTYLMQNTSIKNLSADISTTTRSDGKVCLSALDFTLDAGVLVNLQGMQLVDSLNHSSYAGINNALNSEILQLEKGQTSFETYFYGLTA